MLTPVLILAPSIARTASGNGDAIDLLSIAKWQGQYAPSLLVQLNVSAVSGTSPTLVLVIEDSVDGGVTWNTILTFASVNSVTRVIMANGLRGDAYPAGIRWPFNGSKVRVRWTVGGTTPNFTFDVRANLV